MPLFIVRAPYSNPELLYMLLGAIAGNRADALFVGEPFQDNAKAQFLIDNGYALQGNELADIRFERVELNVEFEIAVQPDRGQQVINYLANNENGTDTFIATYPSSLQVNDNGVSKPIARVQGTTNPHFGVGDLPQIHIAIDAESCWGRGFHMFNASGGKVDNPTHVSLFHELAHAFILVDGQADIIAGIKTDEEQELQTIELENEYRIARSLATIVEDPNNVNYHIGDCNEPGEESASGGGMCFLVTAALNHDTEPYLKDLQHFRDELLQQSTLVDKLYHIIIDEYYKFSPCLACHMRYSDSLKQEIRHAIVLPLIAMLNIMYHISREAESGRTGTYPSLNHGVTNLKWEPWHFDSTWIKEVIAKLGRLQENQTPEDKGNSTHAIDILAFYIHNANLKFHYINWAMIEPIIIFWRYILACKEKAHGENNYAESLHAPLLHWLAAIPLEPPNNSEELAVLISELYQLSHVMRFCPKFEHILAVSLLQNA